MYILFNYIFYIIYSIYIYYVYIHILCAKYLIDLFNSIMHMLLYQLVHENLCTSTHCTANRIQLQITNNSSEIN